MADLRKLTEKEKALYNAQKSVQAQKYQQQANATNGFGQGLLDFVAGGEKPRAVLGGLLDGDTSVFKGLLGEIKQLGNPEYMRNVKGMSEQEALDIALDANPVMAAIVSPSIAKRIDMPVNLPNTDDFISAVKGTKGAEITHDGLKMNLVRFQKPEQELAQSVRNGVFYLPEGSAYTKFYSTGRNGYGGVDKITGETLYKNPLFVKGVTGGKAPEEAYKQLVGKEGFKSMQDDLKRVLNNRRDKYEATYNFLNKYAPDMADDAWHIVDNSKQGNQLRYALQEAVIGNTARQKGHDAILGFSKGRGDKGNFLSEAFDLRESHYPSPDGTSYLNDYFEGLLK